MMRIQWGGGSGSGKEGLSLAALVLLLAVISVPLPANAVDLSQASKAVVKLYVTHQSWDMKQPWSKNRSVSSTCSGFFIEQGILTNAHCLTDSTYIQVELPGVADKVEAVRKAVNHQVDLALIELKDPSQYPEITPVKFDELPAMRDKVVTVGYPRGGRQVSYTEGVVSRIDIMGYAYSHVNSLMVQTDAAINSGNSGGPVFSDRSGAALGVATQRSNRGEAIGYFIPTPVIEQFLTDIKDGTVDGIPALAAFFQGMENPALRTSLNMQEGQTGARYMIAAKDCSLDGLLKKDDVLLSIEGHQVFNDGRAPFRDDSKIGLGYYVVIHQVGDKIKLEILRKGKKKELVVPLKGINIYIIPAMPQFETRPRYYEIGGMLFRPVERRYTNSLGKRNPPGIIEYAGVVRGEVDIDELVVISSVFNASVNKGYPGYVENIRVLKINDQPIKRLEDVSKAFAGGKKRKYHEILLSNRALIVLDRKEVEAEEATIRDRYGIIQYQP